MVNLLSPAGDIEKLKYAIMYGADSVYLAGENFGMRAKAANFTLDEINEGFIFASERGREVNVAVNIMARNNDVKPIMEYIRKLYAIGIRKLIIADPGVIFCVKNEFPDMFITLSTQQSTTNYESLRFWHNNGISRIVLARELPFADIKTICENKPSQMEVEVFVHGAMCISYSGRCLLSNYLAGRDSNKGDCAQPCRWQYSLKEKTREGQYFDIEENENGSFFFNSKDLCLIEHVKNLIDAGVNSFKIEGRMKSIFYVSTVTNAYKLAIKRATLGTEYEWEDLYEELTKVSHRKYTKAFYFGNANEDCQNYGTSSYTRNYDFIAKVLEDTNDEGITKIMQRNKFISGDSAEFVSPTALGTEFTIKQIYDAKMNEREDAPHPAEILYIKTEGTHLKQFDLIRKVSSSK